MASFVVHHTCGINLIKNLEERGLNFTEQNKLDIIYGNLIVDSVDKTSSIPVQTQKIATHFRDLDKLDRIIQCPDLNNFLEKYQHLLIEKNYIALGYYFHLYTDVMFFKDLFNISFTFLDKDYKKTEYIKDTKYVYLHKNRKIIDYREFLKKDTDTNVYDDYTTINKIVLEKFNYAFDTEYLLSQTSNFENPDIAEVNANNISKVINDTNKFIQESYQRPNKELNVFDINDILEFIPNVVNSFIDNNQTLLDNYSQCLKQTKKLGNKQI